MLDWLIEEYPVDRFVLELVERIFCLLWKESKARGNTQWGVVAEGVWIAELHLGCGYMYRIRSCVMTFTTSSGDV